MTIPSSQSLILWISVFSITLPSADFGRLRKTSDFFGRLRTSLGIFGNDVVVFKNPSTPRIKISHLYLRKSWQVYTDDVSLPRSGHSASDRLKFPMQYNQSEALPRSGYSDVSSVWYSCARFSGVILRGNQWWCP